MSSILVKPEVTLASGSTAGAAHRILRNSTFNLLAQGLYGVFHLVVIFGLARGLGKEKLGEYFTLFTLILAVQLILEAGLSTVLTCRIAQAGKQWKETVAEAAGLFALITLASGAAFLALGLVKSWYLQSDMSWPVYVAAGVACAALQVQRFCSGVFRAF